MRRLVVLLLLVTASAAGCLSSRDDAACDEPCAPAGNEGYSSPDNPIPAEGEGATHDHRDPAQHKFSRNATLLAWDDLRDYGWNEQQVVGAHVVDRHEDLLVVGVNAGETADGQQGFHLYDISDPAQLVHLSYYMPPDAVGGDRTVVFSQDGKTVFLGYEGSVRPGVAAIDVSDPTAPKEVAFWSDPEAFGSHTVTSGTIDGVQYVFSLALGVNILRYDGNGFTLVGKYLTADQLAALDAARLLQEGQTGPAQTYALRALYGHDMTFYNDPVTGKDLLVVAYAYEGLKVLDIGVPSAPVLLARWMPPADTAHKHYTHSVALERQPSGQLLMVVGSETFEPENQGIASPLWVLDATVALAGLPLQSEPVHLSTWRNPDHTAAGNLGLSVHFFRLEDGLLYLSHYHGGVWAVDLRTPAAQKDPLAFGYMMPIPPDAISPPEDCCIGFDLDGAPMVFDVVVKDGVVYAADIIQGVTAIRFERPT